MKIVICFIILIILQGCNSKIDKYSSNNSIIDNYSKNTLWYNLDYFESISYDGKYALIKTPHSIDSIEVEFEDPKQKYYVDTTFRIMIVHVTNYLNAEYKIIDSLPIDIGIDPKFVNNNHIVYIANPYKTWEVYLKKVDTKIADKCLISSIKYSNYSAPAINGIRFEDSLICLDMSGNENTESIYGIFKLNSDSTIKLVYNFDFGYNNANRSFDLDKLLMFVFDTVEFDTDMLNYSEYLVEYNREYNTLDTLCEISNSNIRKLVSNISDSKLYIETPDSLIFYSLETKNLETIMRFNRPLILADFHLQSDSILILVKNFDIKSKKCYKYISIKQ